MKRIITLLLSAFLIFTLCSCESENVKNAKAAYEEGKYSEVIELLSQEENPNVNTKDMLAVSEANVLYENKEYVEAVKKLAETSEGIQSEQFEEWFNAALEDCIANKSPDGIIELLAVDESKSDAVYDAVTEACNNKDYNGFLVLDGLVEKLEDGDLKTKLAAFGDEFDILRAEAFLVGNWTGESRKNIIAVMPYKNNLVGTLKKTSGQWGFQKGDIVWQDFEFADGSEFICSILIRYDDGSSDRQLGSCTIDYKKGTITMYIVGIEDEKVTYYRIDK